MDWRAATGLASALVALVATLPYIRATARREIRPSAVTWAGWWLFSAIVFVAQMVTEPSWSAAISGSATGYCGVITVLAVRNGVRFGVLDIACAVLGVVAIAGWQLTRDPRIALAVAMAGDTVLCVPTIVKTLHDPSSELGARFLIVAGGSLLGVVSAVRLDFLSLGWPSYLVLANATIGLVALLAPAPTPARAADVAS